MAKILCLVIVIALAYVCVIVKCKDEVTIKPLQDKLGVLIVAEQPIAFVSFTWRLAFEWDLDPLKEILKTLQNIQQNLTETAESTHPTEQRALVHVSEALQTAEVEFENFLNLVEGGGKDQGKRDLKNPKAEVVDTFRGTAGSLASSLFGLATSEEMEEVHKYLNTLFIRESKIITVEKYHITAVKKMQSQMDMLQEQLNRTINMSIATYEMMWKRTKEKQEANFADLLMHMDLVNTITMFKMVVANYRQTLTTLDRGYINPDLIPVKVLQDTLVQIRDKIPSGFKLIYDPLKDDLTPYYSLKLAGRITGSENIRGMLQIPLTGFTDDYTLYKTIPFPSLLGNSTSRRFMIKDSIRYIALSSDRRRFMDLETIFNPAMCLQGRTLICPTTSSIITEPSADCLFHLISGDLRVGKQLTKCELTEIRTEEVFLQSIDTEEWALSTPNPIQLQPICINLNDSAAPTISRPGIQVKGDVILHIPRQCTITVGHHVIPTRLLMTQDLGKILNKMVIPALHPHQLLDMHGAQLIDEKMDEELNNMFKDMLESHHKTSLAMNVTSEEVRKLMKDMMKETHDAELMKPPIHFHAVTWTTLAFVTVAIIAVIYWVWRLWIRPPVTTVTEVEYVEITAAQAASMKKEKEGKTKKQKEEKVKLKKSKDEESAV